MFVVSNHYSGISNLIQEVAILISVDTSCTLRYILHMSTFEDSPLIESLAAVLTSSSDAITGSCFIP